MHISEGVLSAPVLGGGVALALAGTAVGLKKLKEDKIPQTAILSAAFFCGVSDSCAHRAVQCSSDSQRYSWPDAWLDRLSRHFELRFCSRGYCSSLAVSPPWGSTRLSWPHLQWSVITCLQDLSTKPDAISHAASFACGFLSVFFSSLLVGAALMFTQENFLEVAWARCL